MEIAALGLKVQGVQDIDKAEASLNKFTKSAVDAEKGAGGVADGSKKAGTSLADVAKNSNSAGGALGKVASSAKLAAVQLVAVAAAAMGIGQITKTLAGFEQSMASVAAITRASASEMDAMRKVAKQLGAETEFSASQAADGFKYLGLAGWSAEQSIAAIPGVVDLATAASLGLADAANITSNIMSAYSIGAERATDVTDILAGVSSRANTDVAQLGDAMKYVGPVAASLGISVGDTAAALGVLADASIQGGMGGTALRTVISSLIKPTGDAEKALKAMGLSLSDVNPATNDLSDIVGKLAEKSLSAEQAVTIFGIQGASAISALVAQSPKLAALTEETGNMADEAKRMADVMRDNLQGDLLGFGSALEGVVIAMGEAGLTKALRLVTQAATAFLRKITEIIVFMGDNLPAVGTALALAFGPQVLAGIVTGFTVMSTAVVASVKAIGVAVATNPIGAMFTIAAAAAVLLVQKTRLTEQALDDLDSAAVAIQGTFRDLIGVSEEAGDKISEPWIKLDGIVDTAISAALRYTDYWVNMTVGSAAVVYEAFKASFHNVGASIINAFVDAAKVIGWFVDSTAGLLSSLGINVQTNLMDKIEGAKVDMVDFGKAVSNAWESSKISNMAARYETEKTLTMYEKFMNTPVTKTLAEIAEELGDGGGGGGGGVAKNAKKAADALKTLLDRLFPVDKAAKTLVASIKTLSDAYKKGLIDSDKYKQGLKLLGEEYDNVVIAETKHLKALDERVKTAQGALKTLGEQVAAYGKTESAVARLALAETKSSIITAEAAKAKAIATNASSLHVKQLDIEIKKLYELAEAQGKGLALINEKEGMDAVAEIAKEAERVSGDIERSLTDALLRGFESGKGFAKNLVDTLKNMFNTLVLRPVIQPIAASLAGAVTGALGLGGTAQAGQAASGLGGLSGIGSLFTDFSGKSGQIISEFGQKLFETNGMLADFGKTLMINGESIGNFAGMAGAAFNYGMGALDLFKGNYGAGIGAIGGQLLGGPIGGAIGKTLGGMLDKAFKGETRSGGGFIRHAGGSTQFTGGPSGGYGDIGVMDSALSSFSNSITGVFDALELKGAQLANVVGSFESSEKGRGGTSTGGTLIIDGQVITFGSVDETGGALKGAGYGGKSGSVEEMFANMEKDFAFSALEAFQAVGDRMPEVINRTLADVDIRGLSAEQAQQSVALIQQTVMQVNALIEALDLLPFENLKGLSFDLAASLADAAGGFEALMTGAASYYDAFFSDQEKYETLLESTADEVSRLGYELPDTRDGFRGLVESLDAMDSSNHDAIATLLKLSGAADQVYAYQEKLADEAIMEAQRRADEVAKIAQKEADDAIKAAQDAANERDRMAIQVTNTAKSIMDTFAKISDSISSSFMSLRERITLDIMDSDEDKYNYYKKQYDSLAKQLTQATDANMVQSIVQQMTAAASNAYNLLDEDVRKEGKGQEFIGTLDYAHMQAQQQLDKIQEYQIKQQENSERVAKEMARLTAELAKEVASASREINSASENMQSAAANMARAGVGGRVRGTEATI